MKTELQLQSIINIDRFLRLNEGMGGNSKVVECGLHESLTLNDVRSIFDLVKSQHETGNQTKTKNPEPPNQHELAMLDAIGELETLHEATVDSPLIHAAYGNALLIMNRARV